MKREDCQRCSALERAGVTTEDREICPPEAESLFVMAPGGGHGKFVQIRRCADCDTIYRYRYHSEYDATGSFEEFHLWRLDDASASTVAPILKPQSIDSLDAALASALRSPHEQARETAGLYAWIAMGNGRRLPKSVVAAAETLADTHFPAGNYCYRALLACLHFDAESAAQVRQALTSTGVGARDTRFTWILERDCAEILDAPPGRDLRQDQDKRALYFFSRQVSVISEEPLATARTRIPRSSP